MTTAYIACDGTQFDNEEECLSYEAKINLLNTNAIVFFDQNGTIMHFPPTYDINDRIEEAYFLICRTEECANALNNFIKDECYYYSVFPKEIESNIFYGYDIDGSEKWESIPEVLRNSEARMNKLVNLNEKLSNQLP